MVQNEINEQMISYKSIIHPEKSKNSEGKL